jgi:hypothetical protein
MWFLIGIQQIYKMRVLVSSWKHSLTYRNRVLILNRFFFQLTSLSPYVKIQHEGPRVLLIHRLVERLILERRALQDAEVQSLKQTTLSFFHYTNFAYEV